MYRNNASAVTGILQRAALNMVRTLQQNFRTDMFTGLLRDLIRHQP